MELDINSVSMSVILSAGDGRVKLEEAYEALAEFDFEAVGTLLEEVDALLLDAHSAQTEMIQRQASGEDVTYSLLFTHAQDTLMTIAAEVHTFKKMLPVVKALYMRSCD